MSVSKRTNKQKKKERTPVNVKKFIYSPQSDEDPKKSPTLLLHPFLPEFLNVLQVESPAL